MWTPINNQALMYYKWYLPGGKGDSWTKYEALAAKEAYVKFKALMSSIQRSTKCMIFEWVSPQYEGLIKLWTLWFDELFSVAELIRPSICSISLDQALAVLGVRDQFICLRTTSSIFNISSSAHAPSVT